MPGVLGSTFPRSVSESVDPRTCLQCGQMAARQESLLTELRESKNRVHSLDTKAMTLEAQLQSAKAQLVELHDLKLSQHELRATNDMLRQQVESAKRALVETVNQMRSEHNEAIDQLQERLARARCETSQSTETLKSQLESTSTKMQREKHELERQFQLNKIHTQELEEQVQMLESQLTQVCEWGEGGVEGVGAGVGVGADGRGSEFSCGCSTIQVKHERDVSQTALDKATTQEKVC